MSQNSKNIYNNTDIESAPSRASFSLDSLSDSLYSSESGSLGLYTPISASLDANTVATSELAVYNPHDAPTLVRDETLGHPIYQEPVGTASGKLKFATVAAGIVLGVVLSFAFFISKEAVESADSSLMQVPAQSEVIGFSEAPLSETNEVVSSQSSGSETFLPEEFTHVETKPANELTVQQNKLVPESDLAALSEARAVALAPRTFVYYQDSHRTTGATLVKPTQVKGDETVQTRSARSLQNKGNRGRAVDQGNGTEWQGKFHLNKPQENIAKGNSYAKYVRDYKTSSLQSLPVIQQPRNSLLKSLKGSQVAPKLAP